MFISYWREGLVNGTELYFPENSCWMYHPTSETGVVWWRGGWKSAIGYWSNQHQGHIRFNFRIWILVQTDKLISWTISAHGYLWILKGQWHSRFYFGTWIIMWTGLLYDQTSRHKICFLCFENCVEWRTYWTEKMTESTEMSMLNSKILGNSISVCISAPKW